MDYRAMAVSAHAATTKLAEVIEGSRRFDPADYVQFRQILRELKRDKVPETSLFAHKMDEIYRCVAELDELRRTLPGSARPIRKVEAEIVRLMGVVDAARDRLAAKAGVSNV